MGTSSSSQSFFSLDEDMCCGRPSNKHSEWHHPDGIIPIDLDGQMMGWTTSETSPLSTRSSYLIREQIGKGAFGRVFSAVAKDSPEPLAIKIVPLAERGSPNKVNKEMLAEAEQEVHAWALIQAHPNVIRLVRAFREGVKLCMVMDEVAHGSLVDQKMHFWQLPEQEVASVFKEMLHGVAHVHSCRVVHRDVKPANFLLAGPEGKTAKLADFGLAEMLPPSNRLTGSFGTPPYMSPEMAGRVGHDASTDLWSLGASYYFMFMGQYPYRIDGTEHQRGRLQGAAYKECIVNNSTPPTFVRVNPAANDDPLHQPSALSVELLQSLLHRTAAERMTAKQAFKHAFLNESGKASSDSDFADADSTCGGSTSDRDGNSSPTSIDGTHL